RLGALQPPADLFQPRLERVDVPGGDAHRRCFSRILDPAQVESKAQPLRRMNRQDTRTPRQIRVVFGVEEAPQETLQGSSDTRKFLVSPGWRRGAPAIQLFCCRSL